MKPFYTYQEATRTVDAMRETYQENRYARFDPLPESELPSVEAVSRLRSVVGALYELGVPVAMALPWVAEGELGASASLTPSFVGPCRIFVCLNNGKTIAAKWEWGVSGSEERLEIEHSPAGVKRALAWFEE